MQIMMRHIKTTTNYEKYEGTAIGGERVIVTMYLPLGTPQTPFPVQVPDAKGKKTLEQDVDERLTGMEQRAAGRQKKAKKSRRVVV